MYNLGICDHQVMGRKSCVYQLIRFEELRVEGCEVRGVQT